MLESLWTSNGDRQVRLAGDAVRFARSLLTDEGIGKLAARLQESLGISEEEARSVLFDHPRAIATTVLPTIIRRLEAVIGSAKTPSNFRWGNPLVDFVPSSLFAALQTPEVRVIPPPIGDFQPEPHIEPIAQSMREFAPGRVSYRFALRGKRARMWVEPPASTTPHLDLEAFCTDYLRVAAPPGFEEPVVQPRILQLSHPSVRVSDSSYGRWNWETHFRTNGVPYEIDVPSGSRWAAAIRVVEASTHRARAPLTVWRLARTVEVERHASPEPPTTRHRVRLANRDAAIGFAMEVDGLRIDVLLPEELPAETESELIRALRTTYFEHLVQTDSVLGAHTSSPFIRAWLAQLALCAVVTASAQAGSSLIDLSDAGLSAAMVQAAREVFGAEGPGDDPTVPIPEPGLIVDVENALEAGDVVAALQGCLSSLHGALPSESLAWVHERYSSTVAAGVIGAIQVMCPDLDVNDLRADSEFVSSESGESFARITISEDQPGGTGVIESAVDRIVEDPRAFWDVVTRVLGPCAGERVDRALRRVLEEQEKGSLASEVEQVRSASTLAATTSAWGALREKMFQIGIDADQTVISALATRILRPGSDSNVEGLCRDLLDAWDTLERNLGLEVDLRVFAYLASRDAETRRSLTAITSWAGRDPEWTVGQIVGVLWPRGSKLRAASLESYNPYLQQPSTDRLLLEGITRAPTGAVRLDAVDWREELDRWLCLDGVARITCLDEAEAEAALRDLMTVPTAVGVLEFHPRVVGVERSNTELILTVDIREAQQ